MCVYRPQELRHLLVPLRNDLPPAAGGSVGPFHLVEQLPRHDMRRVAPSRDEVTVFMARQLYGARVGEELLRRFEKAAVLPVPGVFCPVWVRSGGVLPVMLKGQLDENAVPFRKAHDFL
ncbi:MAG: hypothetical protein HPY54_12405 [Chthonomonadetes bacterium]|nr:hypothetical protein [Chthonomonadetes bacterium]